MNHEVYIIDDGGTLTTTVKEIFQNEDLYRIKHATPKNIDDVLRNIPSLIIIDEDNTKENIEKLCSKIRENEDNNITPLVVITSNYDKEHRLQILKNHVEYLIIKPIDNDYLYYTVKNITKLMYLNRGVNPLSGLPGNVQIQAEIRRRILNKEPFAIVYFDLDNFKAYNDVYGFAAGDEIIKYTSKLIMQSIHALQDNDSFNGHVGGDDFVSIISPADYDELCKNVIAHFDNEIEHFYNEEDVRRGYIEVANRRGIIEQFPLVSISIAVVEVDLVTLKSALEIGEIAAQVKHRAKEVMGSSYIINRRRN